MIGTVSRSECFLIRCHGGASLSGSWISNNMASGFIAANRSPPASSAPKRKPRFQQKTHQVEILVIISMMKSWLSFCLSWQAGKAHGEARPSPIGLQHRGTAHQIYYFLQIENETGTLVFAVSRSQFGGRLKETGISSGVMPSRVRETTAGSDCLHPTGNPTRPFSVNLIACQQIHRTCSSRR